MVSPTVVEGTVLEASSAPSIGYKETALEIQGNLEFTTWARTGKTLQDLYDSLGWYLGDWFNYGLAQWGEESCQAVVEATNLKPRTVQNYAWVCEQIPPERRRPELSIGHHYAVAKLTQTQPELADQFLEDAIAGNWKRQELRLKVGLAMKFLPAPGEEQPDAPVLTYGAHQPACPTCTCPILGDDNGDDTDG